MIKVCENNVDFSTSEITSKKVRQNLVFDVSAKYRRQIVVDLTWFARWKVSLLLIAALSATPTKYYCFLLHSSCSDYSLQVLLSAFLSAALSYSCQLLLSSTINRQQLTSRFTYYFQVLLADNIITYSYLLLASTIPIRYFYQLLVSVTLLAYSQKVLLSELLCNKSLSVTRTAYSLDAAVRKGPSKSVF